MYNCKMYRAVRKSFPNPLMAVMEHVGCKVGFDSTAPDLSDFLFFFFICFVSFLKDRLDDYSDDFRDAQPPFQVRLCKCHTLDFKLSQVFVEIEVTFLFVSHS